MKRSRASIVAVTAAGLALVVAVIAVVVVLTRGPVAPRGIAVDDGEIAAADVVALHGVTLEQKDGGITIAGDAGAKLGLRAGDVLVAIDGVAVRDQADYVGALATLAADGSAATLYVEIERDGVPMIVRRTIAGDLQDAWVALHPAVVPDAPRPAAPDPFAGVGSAMPASGDPVDPDDLQQAIEAGITKIDEDHYKISKDLMGKVIANPMAIAKGARVVPAVKNGKPDGFKLYAIRPTSVYAKLGLANGDTIQRINGYEITSADKALEVYQDIKDAKKLVVDIVRRGKPRTLHYTIK
jgi:S1-C subfamily serine protease